MEEHWTHDYLQDNGDECLLPRAPKDCRISSDQMGRVGAKDLGIKSTDFAINYNMLIGQEMFYGGN